ncbi:phosphodiesterase [Escherichia phage Shashou]|nr:phosphodiesterase [Escherichia phage Shashou]
MTNKYNRTMTNTYGSTMTVDVYDVLRAFDIRDPALQHALKKLLCMGLRGHKDAWTDLAEAIESLEKLREYRSNIDV